MRAPLAIAALVVCAAPAQAAERDFTLSNATEYGIRRVHVAAARTNAWSADLLAPDLLKDGQTARIRFPAANGGCLFDIRVAYDDGEQGVWGSFDLCRVSRVELQFSRRTGAMTTAVE
jgi:hypothetical protein